MIRYLKISLLCVLLSACGSGADGNPEEAVRAWVAAAENAAEEKDRRSLLAMISENYVDARGNDHERIGDMLRVYFLRQQSIALLTSIDLVTVSGGTAAQVDMTVGMAGTNSGRFGISADAYRFELELENTDDEWILIGARWGELGGELR